VTSQHFEFGRLRNELGCLASAPRRLPARSGGPQKSASIIGSNRPLSNPRPAVQPDRVERAFIVGHSQSGRLRWEIVGGHTEVVAHGFMDREGAQRAMAVLDEQEDQALVLKRSRQS